MMLSLEGRESCLLCGCQLRAFVFPSVVVNKRSIRDKGGFHLSAGDWQCPECGTAGVSPLRTVFRMTAGSAAEVAEYRSRRWGSHG